eukprot:TRINITY_DN7789_c0_g1_i1.p1 TRINITY_DN7789_c0_g1~~TRINITY_DN7789_c0_g1_i1.p1  ORF type:complete len:1164 (-),score=211.81 TRINITY_DN7789_c0_g1_i1:206-3661(-)
MGVSRAWCTAVLLGLCELCVVAIRDQSVTEGVPSENLDGPEASSQEPATASPEPIEAEESQDSASEGSDVSQAEHVDGERALHAASEELEVPRAPQFVEEPPPLWVHGPGDHANFVDCRCEDLSDDWRDPCSKDDDSCNVRGMAITEAAARCSVLVSADQERTAVAFVTRSTESDAVQGAWCAPRTCCKEVKSSFAKDFNRDYAGHRVALQQWLLNSAGEYMEAANHAFERSSPLWAADQKHVDAQEQEALAMISIGLANASQEGLDAIASCANSEDGGVSALCGNTFQLGEQVQVMLNTLFGILEEYNHLLNLIFQGARRPWNPVAWPQVLLHFGGKVVKAVRSSSISKQGVGKAVVQTIRKFKDFCWAKRHIIFGAGVILMNGATLGSIIESVLVETNPQSGFLRVAQAFMAEVTTQLICPLTANALAMGFVVQWFVEKMISSDSAMEMLKKLAWPLKQSRAGWQKLRGLLSQKNADLVDGRMVQFVKELNDSPWALIVWTFLFSSVSSLFNVFSVIGCSVLGGANKGLNIAADAVEGGTKHATRWLDGVLLNVKEHFGVDTHDARHVLERQHLLEDSMSEVYHWHDLLKELHETVTDVTEVVDGAADITSQVGLAALRGANFFLASIVAGEKAALRLEAILGSFFSRVDSLPGIVGIIGAGTASAIALSRPLGSAFKSLRGGTVDVQELLQNLQLDEADFSQEVVSEAQRLRLHATKGADKLHDVWSSILEAHLLALGLDFQLKGEDAGAHLMAARHMPLPQVKRISECPAAWKLPWNRLGDRCACKPGLCPWCGEQGACCSTEDSDNEPPVCHAVRELSTSLPIGRHELSGGSRHGLNIFRTDRGGAAQTVCARVPDMKGTRFESDQEFDAFNKELLWDGISDDPEESHDGLLPFCSAGEYPAQCVIRPLPLVRAGVENFGQDCSGHCQLGKKCDFCGPAGKCCRFGWGSLNGDCLPHEGMQSEPHHVCVGSEKSVPDYFADDVRNLCRGTLLLLEVTPTNDGLRTKLFDTERLFLPLRLKHRTAHHHAVDVSDTTSEAERLLSVQAVHDGVQVTVARGEAAFSVAESSSYMRAHSVRVHWNVSAAMHELGAPEFMLTYNNEIYGRRFALPMQHDVAVHDQDHLPLLTTKDLKPCIDLFRHAHKILN